MKLIVQIPCLNEEATLPQALRAIDDLLGMTDYSVPLTLALAGPHVVVAAGSKHRDEAFRACRMAIEAVKHTAPIWKQEHFSDGDSVWSEGCSLCVPADGHD